MGATWSQFFPSAPQFTEKSLPSLTGKIFLITGGSSGVGYQLATILYQAGGTVYIGGRSQENAERAISDIKAASSTTAGQKNQAPGRLEFLFLDLQDLASIKPAVAEFRQRESKLHVLWNNAGVSLPPVGSVSAQGHELMMATNCLGSLLLAQLLVPSLQAAVENNKDYGRVVWTSSQMVDLSAPKGGINISQVTTPPKDQTQNYTNSKTGNWFLASEFGRRQKGIISITQNPGNLKTNLLRHAPTLMRVLSSPLLYEAKYGAYTELWAGLAPELDSLEMNGRYVVPWGNLHSAPRQDLLDALKTKEEGGTGQAKEFVDWCEEQIKDYL